MKGVHSATGAAWRKMRYYASCSSRADNVIQSELSYTYRFHAVRHEPMEAFDEQEESKHDDKGYIEVIPKYGEREQGLRDEHPCLIIQPLGIHDMRSIQVDST